MRRLRFAVMVATGATLCVGLASQASSKPADLDRWIKNPIPVADLRKPISVATTFLAAALAKNPVRLREVTAHDAATMAEPGNRPLFAAILNQTLTSNDRDRLAAELEGFEIEPFVFTATGKVRVPMTKPGPDHSQRRRSIHLRIKKRAWNVFEWKVFDFSGQDLPKGWRS